MISRAALASWFVVTLRSIPVEDRCPDTDGRRHRGKQDEPDGDGHDELDNGEAP